MNTAKFIIDWGQRAGSVYLRDQKVALRVPRIRNKETKREVALESYRKLERPYNDGEETVVRLINGLSAHKYRESAELLPEVFGISASTVSRRFQRGAEKALSKLQNRDLSSHDFVTIFIDGKRFAQEGLVIALGATMQGQKIMLGIEQMNTENSLAVSQFIDRLISHGLRYEEGLLVVVDGAKGLTKALREKSIMIGKNWTTFEA